MAAVKGEKYLLCKSMHLGFIKESFTAGTTIERKGGKLHIGGTVYDCTKDLDILLRHELAKPYSPKLEEEIKGSSVKVLAGEKTAKEPTATGMKVVKSDEDLMDKGIDIKYTKKAKVEKVKTDKLPVIKGDEDVDSRMASAVSEKKVMPIIHDDSLGQAGGYSLNAGQVKVVTAADKARLAEIAKAKAEGMKAQVEAAKAQGAKKKLGRPKKPVAQV